MTGADDLNALAADLDRSTGQVGKGAAAVVRKGAHNVMTEARQFASGIAHAPHYPRSISYDVEGDGRFAAIEAVIGPDKDRPQGALGNILEYGTSKNAPLPHLGPALDREGPRFVKALEDLAGDALDGL